MRSINITLNVLNYKTTQNDSKQVKLLLFIQVTIDKFNIFGTTIAYINWAITHPRVHERLYRFSWWWTGFFWMWWLSSLSCLCSPLDIVKWEPGSTYLISTNDSKLSKQQTFFIHALLVSYNLVIYYDNNTHTCSKAKRDVVPTNTLMINLLIIVNVRFLSENCVYLKLIRSFPL